MENDWHDYDLMDISTHPNNGTKVEIQSADGETAEVIFGEEIVGIVGQVNSPLREIPEKANWRCWRYV